MFYIIFALGPGFIARISRRFFIVILEFSFEGSVKEPFEPPN
ncbi:MAG: hypothetical protein SPL35_01295 [Bacteroidales bacterium]|nr:hypothetical protein [Bacteroidales bacterium]